MHDNEKSKQQRNDCLKKGTEKVRLIMLLLRYMSKRKHDTTLNKQF